MKKIVLTGGGTAGHVTPNIALIPLLRAQGFEIHYIGTSKGLERDLISRENIPYHAIAAGKLRRYVDFRNLTDIFRILIGSIQAFFILLKVGPDVVFSKGGFVSCPVVWASWLLRIPSVIHESDMTPGLANRLSIPFTVKVCYSFPETGGHIKVGKGVYTGLPVRQSLLSGDPARGRCLCKFKIDSKPVIMVIGGSQGAQAINKVVRESLDRLLVDFNVCHICGKGGTDKNGRDGYAQFEYVNQELPDLFAAADCVISRAGATTIFEILALRKPSILIPLPLSASRGDQILNARSFERNEWCAVLPQEELTAETLADKVRTTMKERERMIGAMTRSGIQNGADKVLQVILEYGK